MSITKGKLCGGAGCAASCAAPHHRDVDVKMLLTIVALLPAEVVAPFFVSSAIALRELRERP